VTVIYLAGAEDSDHRDLLLDVGASRLAVNAATLLRSRNVETWSLELGEDEEWVVYADAPLDLDDLSSIEQKVNKPPLFVTGSDRWAEHPMYSPFWTGEGDVPRFGPSLFVSDKVVKDKTLSRKVMSRRLDGAAVGAVTGTTQQKLLSRFDVVVSSAWWSTMRYGETQIWTGTEMKRYDTTGTNAARTKYADLIESYGIDMSKLVRDDPQEMARLAITSWIEYQHSLETDAVLLERSEAATAGDTDTESGALDHIRLASNTPEARHERTVLPVVGVDKVTFTTKRIDGSDDVEEIPVITSSAANVRQCSNCHLADVGCPQYQPNSLCAYEIPVVIKSRDQLQAALQAVVEMQTQRVFEARFSEQLQGQELAPEVGTEVERLFRMVEKMKGILDDRESIKVTMEAKGKSGVLSRLFGDTAGENARALGTPIPSDDILEAVVLED
jgi:hypothetical protein